MCESDTVVYRFHSVDEALDQQLERPEEEEEEVAEDKETFLDALEGLKLVRKNMCHFDLEDSIVTMCNKLEKVLYRLRVEGWERGSPY